ncbi:MAG: chemotaxis protein CheA, partial [Chloroflexi bacterium]
MLNEIFRAAHTIKGSSATIGHARMASLTHAMETRLDDVRKRTASVTPELIEALLRALDVLKLLRDEVETRVAADVDVDDAAIAVERRAALRSLPPATDEETLRLTVTLEDGPWAAVRALQALLALGEHGRVLSSEPSQAEIER